MLILHTSDWHLGQVFYNHDREAEQRAVLEQIATIVAEWRPDVMVVSGDVFHTAMPSAAARRLYVDGLLAIHRACPTMPIVVTAGNHDSASRLEADGRLWQLAGVTVVGGLARDDEGNVDAARHIVTIPGKGVVVALPHVYAGNIPTPDDVPRAERFAWLTTRLLDAAREANTDDLPIVLMAHVAVADSDFTGHDNVGLLDTIPLAALGEGYDYAALGHIHRPQTLDGSDGRVRYCGTPLAVSFDERCEHSVTLVRVESGETPAIETVRITNPKPLHTILSDPAPLDEAMQALAAINPTEECYVRLNVLAEGHLPADTRERATQAVAGMAAVLCDVVVTRPAATDVAARPSLTVSELRALTPLDVARRHMAAHGTPLTSEQEELIKQAMENIDTEP